MHAKSEREAFYKTRKSDTLERYVIAAILRYRCIYGVVSLSLNDLLVVSQLLYRGPRVLKAYSVYPA